MRYEQIRAKDSFTKVDVAAVWPTGVQVAPAPVMDYEAGEASAFAPTPAAPDVPASVGGMIAGSYALLLGAFALATAGSAHSIFMIAIAGLFLISYFTVPWLFFRQEPSRGRRPGFERFLRDGMETLTGHSTGGAALVQMIIVPMLLTFAVVMIGIAASVIL